MLLKMNNHSKNRNSNLRRTIFNIVTQFSLVFKQKSYTKIRILCIKLRITIYNNLPIEKCSHFKMKIESNEGKLNIKLNLVVKNGTFLINSLNNTYFEKNLFLIIMINDMYVLYYKI